VTRIYRDWSAYSLTAEQIAWLNARNFASVGEMLGLLFPVPRAIQALVPKAAAPALGNAFAALNRRAFNG